MNVRLEVMLEPTNGEGKTIYLEFPSTCPAYLFSMDNKFGREALMETINTAIEECRVRLEQKHNIKHADKVCAKMETVFENELDKFMQGQEYAVTWTEEHCESCELCNWNTI